MTESQTYRSESAKPKPDSESRPKKQIDYCLGCGSQNGTPTWVCFDCKTTTCLQVDTDAPKHSTKASMATLDLHLLDKDNLIYLVQSLAAKWGGK